MDPTHSGSRPGWHVTAVDFSAAALAHARSTAEAAGTDVARRVDWVEADLEYLDAAAGTGVDAVIRARRLA